MLHAIFHFLKRADRTLQAWSRSLFPYTWGFILLMPWLLGDYWFFSWAWRFYVLVPGTYWALIYGFKLLCTILTRAPFTVLIPFLLFWRFGGIYVGICYFLSVITLILLITAIRAIFENNLFTDELESIWKPPDLVAESYRAKLMGASLLLAWFLISFYCELSPKVALQPASPAPRIVVKEKWENLRIAIALSGGGYRAALFHAGVLHELQRRDVPITHIAGVSGGSIIGAYFALEGRPIDFLAKIKGGEMTLSRRLLSLFTLIRFIAAQRLPGTSMQLCPVGSLDLLDLQVQALDRALFHGAKCHELNRCAIKAVFGATDLSTADNVGISGSILWTGPMINDWYKGEPSVLQLPPQASVAELVGASGAFPGVFPTLSIKCPVLTNPVLQDTEWTEKPRELWLADGGIRDNSGLELVSTIQLPRITAYAREMPLWMAAATARAPYVGRLIADWQVDGLIVSNGGQYLEDWEERGSSFFRAVNIMYENRTTSLPISNLQLTTLAPWWLVWPTSMSWDGSRNELVGRERQHQLGSIIVEQFLDILTVYEPNKQQDQRFEELYKNNITQLKDEHAKVDELFDRFKENIKIPWFEYTELVYNVLGAKESHGSPSTFTPDHWLAKSLIWGSEIPDPEVRELFTAVVVDLDECISAFVATSTLSDRFDIDQADKIFKLGQYYVATSWPLIEQELNNRASQPIAQSPYLQYFNRVLDILQKTDNDGPQKSIGHLP